MSESIQRDIITLLKEEVAPAMGCTEPVAVALAIAKAKALIGAGEDDITQVEVKVSANILKNGLGVGIPGTNDVGLHMASALGVTCCQAEDGLNLFNKVKSPDQRRAKAWLTKGLLQLSLADTSEKLYISARVITKNGYGYAVIRHRHDYFMHLETHEGLLLDLKDDACPCAAPNPLLEMPIMTLIKAIEDMPNEPLLWLGDGLKMNKSIAQAGINTLHGMGVGYSLNQKIKKGLLGKDLMNLAMALTSAASDARMGGISLPVMSSNGSGNNGLTALLPIVAYQEIYPTTPERLAKAAAMSHLVNSVIKTKIGRLSAICGCGVAAGTGAAVALAWLMDATHEQLEGVIQNMIANTSGMLCDGAKVGCALKLATSASAAVQSALLACDGIVVPSGNGIVGTSADVTLHNLGVLSKEAMPTVDRVILKIMTQAL